MPVEVTALFTAVWGVALYGLTQPWIGPLAGGVVGGYTLGTAKNRRALDEIVRSVFFGGMAWLFISAAQALIAQGV